MRNHIIPRLTLLFLTLLAISPPTAGAAGTKPNILWLLAEDIGPEAFSLAGTPEAHTPVIDQLAREGVNYTRAYTTAPVCSPSRSALITGMYATTIGAHQHRTKNKSPCRKESAFCPTGSAQRVSLPATSSNSLNPPE